MNEFLVLPESIIRKDEIKCVEKISYLVNIYDEFSEKRRDTLLLWNKNNR